MEKNIAESVQKKKKDKNKNAGKQEEECEMRKPWGVWAALEKHKVSQP